MARISWYLFKAMSKIFHSNEIMNNYYRKQGVTIGKNCLICSNIGTGQGFLINIGDNCTIASDVLLVTHDYSIHNVIGKGTLFGSIWIGNNCFIGARSIVLPGVSLSDNTIVAAGSVVTKSIPDSNVIIAGNPAKIIGTWDNYKEKYENYAVRFNGSNKDLISKLSSTPDKLIEK